MVAGKYGNSVCYELDRRFVQCILISEGHPVYFVIGGLSKACPMNLIGGFSKVCPMNLIGGFSKDCPVNLSEGCPME